MTLLLDNVLAGIIACTVGLVLLATQTRINEQTIERTRYYAARRSQAIFLQTLERDLHNVVSLTSVKMGTTDSTFTFTAYLDSTNTTQGTVSYRYKRAGTAGGTPIYRVQRFVTQGGTTTQNGGTLDALIGWNVEARSDDNVAVTTASDARQIYIWFSSVSPLANASGSQSLSSVGSVQWEARYRPPLLRPDTDV